MLGEVVELEVEVEVEATIDALHVGKMVIGPEAALIETSAGLPQQVVVGDLLHIDPDQGQDPLLDTDQDLQEETHEEAHRPVDTHVTADEYFCFKHAKNKTKPNKRDHCKTQ